MIVDTSAVVAILFGEPEADTFADALSRERSSISAAGYLECSIVADRFAVRSIRRRDSSARALLTQRLDAVISSAGLDIAPVTRQQADIARWAHREFGVGSGSPARLNFGDCFSYALAKDADEPLLFKGDDFTHTDIRGYLSRNA